MPETEPDGTPLRGAEPVPADAFAPAESTPPADAPLVRAAPAPADAGLQTVPLVPASSDSARLGSTAVRTGALDVEPFQAVGVTWAGAADLQAWVRVRADGDADWSPWYELPGDDEHAPEPGTAEAAAGIRGGTDPLLVPSSDAVEVTVSAADGAVLPRDLRLDLVDPGADPASAASAPEAMATEVRAGQPTIRSRAQWGADESLRADPPEYGEVHGAFVHHTVSANAYAATDVPSMIRSIYSFHVRSRGWNDIGYNFIVDRFGRLWEGRYGGIARAVTGAHTQGYNDDAFAVSALGNYDTMVPSNALLRAVSSLIGWKFGVHGVNPLRAAIYDGERWTPIAGHRDAAATACPGAQLYSRLSLIRAGTLRSMGIGGDATGGRDVDSASFGDIVARQRSSGSLWLWPGRWGGGFGSPVSIGTGWQAMDVKLLPGDLNGDGHDDVLARRRTDGTMWFYPGLDGGRLGRGVRLGAGWAVYDAFAAVGDWNGDGRPDIVARHRNGGLVLFAGNGKGGLLSGRTIGTGWQAMTALVGPGDWNGDGAPDVIARRGDGALMLYPGNGSGGFGSPRRIGSGWNGMAGITGGADVTGDGVVDLLAWTSGGVLYAYPGDGRGGFLPRVQYGGGWNAFDLRS
ncbi:FG-GAP-like repeat-containing protein [Jiangella endophytica]|uniref:FG-GAP-like repeat-containing protein n=1 Tax=Jiangella endophytica TaxID=1623398 RepID=UPI0013008FD9|nr:FG-GAP-like repeat-containing protein [Jiangella endophytica]